MSLSTGADITELTALRQTLFLNKCLFGYFYITLIKKPVIWGIIIIFYSVTQNTDRLLLL
jgi:hypothetical protein